MGNGLRIEQPRQDHFLCWMRAGAYSWDVFMSATLCTQSAACLGITGVTLMPWISYRPNHACASESCDKLSRGTPLGVHPCGQVDWHL
jgi:hypothetical protein